MQNLDGAQFALGWLCENGEGVDTDPAQALRWYRFAAEQGHPLACDKVAHFYDAGLVVNEDKDEAERWFSRALLGGLISAEHDLERLRARREANQQAAVSLAACSSPQASSGGNESSQFSVVCAHRSNAGAANAPMQLRVKTSKSKERGSKSQ